MGNRVEQLQKKGEGSGQHESTCRKKSWLPSKANGAMEIWSSNDSRVGNLCYGECIKKEKHRAKLQPAETR